jgi:NADH:ubiquinone oxidoreductase subunit D
MADLPPDFVPLCEKLLDYIPPRIADVETLIDKNRIWMDRSVGVSAISGADAVDWGWTGPCLRASGVAYDVRRAQPYDLYDSLEFEVPVLQGGDVYDRYKIRMLEIRESLAIVRQLLDRGMPEGPVIVDDPHVALPPKDAAYNQMESMIYHFKLIMDGIQVPAGERSKSAGPRKSKEVFGVRGSTRSSAKIRSWPMKPRWSTSPSAQPVWRSTSPTEMSNGSSRM